MIPETEIGFRGGSCAKIEGRRQTVSAWKAGAVQTKTADQPFGNGSSLTVEESAGASLPNHFLCIAAIVPSFFIVVSASFS